MGDGEHPKPARLGPEIMKLAFQEFARLGGRARAKALSKAKRQEIAKRAVTVRNQKLSAKQRAAIASKAGRAGAAARWGKARKLRPRIPESPQESLFAAEQETEDEERPLR